MDAELRYYDRCRDVLVQLKQDWPARYVRPCKIPGCV